ncbi:putative polypeptide N-acetylgalactosaminyltransferase 13, partial [Condylostylus longicornis]|uniref:putative polypeptide N-acetylgalactosaminyltransferase 13 n=1 Tax=Condylostylus longicornis TaxID=2530218 RepID=UPI00244DAC57
LRRKKFFNILIISSIISFSCFFIINLKFVLRTSRFSGLVTQQILETINIDDNLVHNFDIYIARDYKNYSKSKIKYPFAVENSNKIGGIRQLPDTRSESCKNQIYDLPDDITVSVIITFYNEARSTLLRTIVSVLQRTPLKYLKEIIVIDDFNEDDTQGIDLQFLPLIKLIRNNKRFGVIKSRNIGAKLATGKYIFFLDSHCELNVGWLEPLISRLYLYPKSGVSPILDIINSKTFQYEKGKSYLKGGFDWKLNFNWIPMTEKERVSRIKNGYDETVPFASPAFSGGIFMMSKEWFLTLQGFNELLKMWGGESIEMAIKLWCCGGQIDIVPCSRVGHLFTQEHSFDLPMAHNAGTYISNTKVIAESWLDEYKYFFYSIKPKASAIEMPDTSRINELKEKLQCQSFSWFLRNVMPEMRLPNEEYIAFGKLTSGNKCLSIKRIIGKNTLKEQNKTKLIMKNCQDTDVTDWYLHSTTGKLSTKSGTDCINVMRKTENVIVEKCNNNEIEFSNSISNNNNNNVYNNINFENQNTKNMNKIFSTSLLLRRDREAYNMMNGGTQSWIRSGENLIHKDTQLCLDNFNKDKITVSLCRRGNPSQLFSFSVELQKL